MLKTERIDLNRRIDELLSSSYRDEEDSDYQGSFVEEGSRKSGYITDDLAFRESQGHLNRARLAYLSIGGADGSEVTYVMEATGISKAVMIEMSAEGVKHARCRAEALAKHAKTFTVIQGDATAMLDEALRILESWNAEGSVDGLVCSIQGVLHELPMRSPAFDLPVFLGKVFRGKGWRALAFYSREPSTPSGWPDKVRIRIPGVDAERLRLLALLVRDRLNMSGDVEVVGKGWLDVPSPLAIETLHKLIREGSVRRIVYELGEQLTSLDPMEVKKHLESLVDGMRVFVDSITTNGFKNALREYNVEYVGHNSEPLPTPKTHAEIIGFRPDEQSLETTAVRPLLNQKFALNADDKINNPFGSHISDEELQNWIEQFRPDERKLVSRLFEGFVFISSQRMLVMLEQLHRNLEILLGTEFKNVRFLPAGGPGKSGGYVSFLYRRQNGIGDKAFISLEELRQLDAAGTEIIVILDDILASGHQAALEIKNLQTLLADSSRILFGTVVSYEAGTIYVREHFDVEIVSALHLDRTHDPFNSASVVFPDPTEREKVREIVRRYGSALFPKSPFGYSGSSLLLAFEQGTPDNTLPIFWSSANGWKPLLKKGTPPRS